MKAPASVETTHATLRFAAGVTASFAVGELLQWTPTFLAAVLASALLGNLPGRPPLKVGVLLIVVMTASALFSFVLSALLRGDPTVLFGLIGVVMLLAFHAIHSGKPRLPALLLLICLATVPLLMLLAPAYGELLPMALVHGIIVALLVVWTVFTIWPKVLPPAAPPPSASATTPAVTALISTAVVLPVLLTYLMLGLYDVLPVLICTVMLAVEFDPRQSHRQAFMQVLANFAGGLFGLLMYMVSKTVPNLAFLAAVMFLVLLGFGRVVAAGGTRAQQATIACNASLIILGSALASGSGPLSLWLIRVFQFALAGAFVIGAMNVLWHFVAGRHATPAPRADP